MLDGWLIQRPSRLCVELSEICNFFSCSFLKVQFEFFQLGFGSQSRNQKVCFNKPQLPTSITATQARANVFITVQLLH